MNTDDLTTNADAGQVAPPDAKHVLNAVTHTEISFVVVASKIQPCFNGGNVFSKRQVIYNGSKKIAERRAADYKSKTGKDVAVWEVNYESKYGCITLLKMISCTV
jgi:hypothetical protein